MKRMETLPQCDFFFPPLSFFIGMLTERTIKEVTRKKLHSLNRR